MDLQNILKNVFCLLLIVVHKTDAIYTLTENVYTWSESTQVCTLASPSLVFNENGTTPDLANLLSVDAWLGYTEKMTPFEYFGCYKKSDLNLTTANYTTEGDPGKCWSACYNNIKAVAVYDNECYCLHDVNVDTNKLLNYKCKIGCPSQPNIACGGDDGKYEYVSLYKTTYTGPIRTSSSDANLCLWYDRSTATFLWGNCTNDYLIICYHDKNVWLYNGSVAYGNWITMTTRCFKDYGIPSTYNNIMNLNTTRVSEMWTGVIRNGVIYPNPTNVNEGKYGYVDIATGKLSFTNDTTVRKRALCVEGTVIVETTTSTVETTTDTVETNTSTGKTTISTGKTTTSTGKTTTSTGKTTTSTGKTTISTGKTTTSTVKATTNTGKTTSSTAKQTSSSNGDNVQTVTPSYRTDEDSINIGAIVGVTLSIAVIIIVTVIIVVLWKRGIRLQVVRKAKSDSQNQTAANKFINATGHDNAIQGTPEVNVHSYDEIDISDISPGNTMAHVDGDNNSRNNYDEAHTYRNIENPASNVVHTYSNLVNKQGGEHTYQNQEKETSDEAHLYLDLQNNTSDDHAYAGLEARVPRSK